MARLLIPPKSSELVTVSLASLYLNERTFIWHCYGCPSWRDSECLGIDVPESTSQGEWVTSPRTAQQEDPTPFLSSRVRGRLPVASSEYLDAFIPPRGQDK